MADYDSHYELLASLQADGRIIPPPRLFNYSGAQIYAAQMDRIAQNLPNGQPSPFSSKAPGSTHSALISTLTNLVEMLGHEIDLIPDRGWLHLLRLLGVELEAASYPVVTLEFSRSVAAIAAGIPVPIPIGTAVRSRIPGANDLVAYTLETVTILDSATTVSVNARLNTLGSLTDLTLGQFTLIEDRIAYIDTAIDTAIVSTGVNAETISDAVLKVRQGVRAGSLGRFTNQGIVDVAGDTFLGRCVTLRDYVYYAERLGATKAVAWRGQQLGSSGYFGDLITVAVYPIEAVALIAADLRKLSVTDRLDVVGATVIPIDGTITVRTVPYLSERDVNDLAATAIVSKCNPPYGTWGDLQFAATISTALEQVDGIYAVPSVVLKHAVTGIPLAALEVEPYHLFQIQNTIVLNIVS